MSTITPDQLSGFLTILRTRGWRIGIDDYIAAQRLLREMHESEVTIGDIRDSIGSMVCSSAQEQRAYGAFFEDFFITPTHIAQKPRETESPALARAAENAIVRRGRSMLWIAAITAIAAGILLGGVFLVSSREQPVAPPVVHTGIKPDHPATALTTATTATMVTGEITSSSSDTLLWSLLLAVAGIGCFFVSGIFILRHRRRSALRREFGSARSFEEHLLRIGSGPAWPELRLLSSRLHLRIPSEVVEFDVEKTIEASAANGGWPTPVDRTLRFLPHYVVMIDRLSARDHLASVYDSLVQGLKRSALPLAIYEFRGDPRTLRTMGVARKFVTEREVERLHHGARLIVLSDTEGLVNPVSGQLLSWPSTPAAWSRRYLVAPAAIASQNSRVEKLRQRGFDVVSADRSGLQTLAQIVAEERVRRGTLAKPRKPLSRSVLRSLDRRPSNPEAEAALCEKLRNVLGNYAYLWLSACAVYPSLQSQLTSYLGDQLGLADTEGLLARLIELPWFRRGFMPDWLRVALLDRIAPEDETRVRDALTTLFNQALKNTSGGFELPIATRPTLLTKIRRAVLLSDLRASQDVGAPARDQVLLDFMNGRKPQRLHVHVPSGLRRFLMRRRPKVTSQPLPPRPLEPDVQPRLLRRGTTIADAVEMYLSYLPILALMVWTLRRNNRELRFHASRGLILGVLSLSALATLTIVGGNSSNSWSSTVAAAQASVLLLYLAACIVIPSLVLIDRRVSIPIIDSLAEGFANIGLSPLAAIPSLFFKSRRGGELVGIAAMLMGISLGIALVTYHADDPSAFFTSSNTGINNAMGYYGASLARLLIGFFGFASLLFPAILVGLGWKRFWGREVVFFSPKLIGFLVIAVSAPVLLDLAIGRVLVRGVPMRSGGYLGSAVDAVLAANLNRTGAALGVMTTFLTGVLLTTGRSLAPVLVAFRRQFLAAGRLFGPYTQSNRVSVAVLTLQAFVLLQTASRVAWGDPATSRVLMAFAFMFGLLSGVFADRLTGSIALLRLSAAMIGAGYALTLGENTPLASMGNGLEAVGFGVAAPPLLMLALRVAGSEHRRVLFFLIAACCGPAWPFGLAAQGLTPLGKGIMIACTCVSIAVVRATPESTPVGKLLTNGDIARLLGMIGVFALGQQSISWLEPPNWRKGLLLLASAIPVFFLVLLRAAKARSSETTLTFAFVLLGTAAMASFYAFYYSKDGFGSGASVSIAFASRILLDSTLLSVIAANVRRGVHAQMAAMYLCIGGLVAAIPPAWGARFPSMLVAMIVGFIAIIIGVSISALAALRERRLET